jgi:hypothetical protein
MRRAAGFADRKRIEAEHVGAAARQRMERRTPHQAEADDGNPTAAHRASSIVGGQHRQAWRVRSDAPTFPDLGASSKHEVHRQSLLVIGEHELSDACVACGQSVHKPVGTTMFVRVTIEYLS